MDRRIIKGRKEKEKVRALPADHSVEPCDVYGTLILRAGRCRICWSTFSWALLHPDIHRLLTVAAIDSHAVRQQQQDFSGASEHRCTVPCRCAGYTPPLAFAPVPLILLLLLLPGFSVPLGTAAAAADEIRPKTCFCLSQRSVSDASASAMPLGT